MSGGMIFGLFVAGMFPALILIAAIVKWRETRIASRWPETQGKVITSTVKVHERRPGEIGYNSTDTNLINFPFIEYEYQVNGKTYRNSVVEIGETPSSAELDETLARYPVGTEVKVYYDPSNPKKTCLERDFPIMLYWGVGFLILFFLAIPLIGILAYTNAVQWLAPRLVNTGRAPIVAILSVIGFVTVWFALAFHKMIAEACAWPVTPGKIVTTEVQAFWKMDHQIRRTLFRPKVIYRYAIDGREYLGDRITLGVTFTSTLPGLARRTLAKYPEGAEVDVYYNPSKPSESVLRPISSSQFFPWLMAAAIFGLAYAIGTGIL